jgi:tryptophan-rich sensory protein
MNSTYSWYQTLLKPTWAPPSWIFGPVWTVLYILIALSFGFVLYNTYTKKLSWKVALPFILNLIFNFLFTPIQFGLQNNILAAVDVALVWSTLVWAMYMIWNTSKKFRWIVYINIPYLLWVSFATVLQFTVTYLNW